MITYEEYLSLKPGDIINVQHEFGHSQIYCFLQFSMVDSAHIGQPFNLPHIHYKQIISIVIRTEDLCKECLVSTVCNKVLYSLKCYKRSMQEDG